jgi:soluble epoxide hydrolase/lipid-phosphate phosphatase
MDTLTKRTVQTLRGFTYTYYVSPASAGKPIILLLHGWPDCAALWDDLAVRHLIPTGYGLIIPDCLGFGSSSQPTDPQSYNPAGLTSDFIDILDAEHVETVIYGGHDWGAGLASRLYHFHPGRCAGLITLNMPVSPRPEAPIVLDQLASTMIKSIGYFPGWYWYLFSDPVKGPALLDQHIESLFTALHAEPEAWMSTLCAKDGVKKWLEEDKKGPVQAYATDAMRKDFITRMTRDGFAASLCYYLALVTGIFYEGAKELPAERYKVSVPYLFVAGMQDIVCRAEGINQAIGMGLTPNLTIEEVDAGHWCMLAKPKEVGEIFVKWLRNNYERTTP